MSQKISPAPPQPLEWWQVIEMATVRQLAAMRQAGTVNATDRKVAADDRR